MKLKKIVLCSVITVLLGTTAFVYANTDYLQMKKDKPSAINLDTGKTITSDEETKIQESYNSDTYNVNKKKVAKMLDDVWEDIKKTHGIDETGYIKFTIQDLSKQPDHLKDVLSDQEIAEQIHVFMTQWPVGATEPTILVKKDKKEVMFAYKDKDNNNILSSSKKYGKSWKQSQQLKKGKAKLDLNSISAD